MENEYREPDFMLEPAGMDKRYPSFTAGGVIMLCVLLGFFAFNYLLAMILSLCGITETFLDNAAVYYGVNALFEIAYIGVPMAIILGIYNKNISAFLRLNSMSGKQIVLVVLIGLCAFVANILLTEVNILAATFLGPVEIPDAPEVKTVLDKLMLVASVVVVAPITEELIMRGVIMRGLEGRSKWFSFIITGAFFGFLHLSYYTAVPKVLMGILLCYVVYITNSVYAGIIIHLINNGISVLIELFSSGATVEDTAEVITDINLIPANEKIASIIMCSIFSIGFITAIIALVIALRNSNKTPNEDGTYTNNFTVREKLPSESKIKPMGYIAIAVTFIIMIGYMVYDFLA